MPVLEIQRAEKIHDYIQKLEKLTNIPLRSSPIILSSPRQKVSLELPVEGIKQSYEYIEQLYEDVGEHELVFKAIKTGWEYLNSGYKIVPPSKEEYFRQINEAYVFQAARERGYTVSEDSFKEHKFCYGQYETYYAVHEIMQRNAFDFLLSKSYSPSFIHTYANWHKCIKLISTQFIIPTTTIDKKFPHILDQLWVISHNVNQLRLLGIEIVGEGKFLSRSQPTITVNNEFLNQLGYEIYQVASWWCRVDPYRVICEFLKASGIFPDATKYLIGAELNTIDEYACGICHAPMVRWGWDWIQRYQIGNSTVLAHKDCVMRKLHSGKC
ncbi:hypothetical protein [Chroococcidiopsis sp. TS-821]|uniref:hypothetical protein n=1 Tax=Chroococcidiopsis sp. TS-821 TaxID=1378066 RepID=UPI000CEF36A2|nr:hypothetical protein [Chroococcidiopsis sp. TS-821]PPS43178.1 hypothetical protein B1A85_10730 [Chroococcidiopsis sp. TS-821]